MRRLIFLAIFLFPFSAGAITTHTFSCADFATYDGTPVATCTGDVWTLSGSAGMIDNAPTVGVPSSATWYISATYSGTGGYFLRFNCPGTDGTAVNGGSVSTTLTDQAISSGTGGTCYLRFIANGGGGNFVGTLSNICLSDTIGQCSGGGGGGSATTTPYAPQQQEWLFMFGLFLFLAGVPFWQRVLSITKGSYNV